MRRPPSRAGSTTAYPIARGPGPPVSHEPPPTPRGKDPGARSNPVRILGGFFADLPPSGVIFYDRHMERPFPKPLMPVVNESWQKGYEIWADSLPKQRTLIITDLSFTAYRNDNIGVGQPIAVPPGALSDSLGFQFTIGERWEIDIKNNLQGAGAGNVAAAGGNSGIGLQEFSVNGRMDPTGSSFSRRYGRQGKFALFCRGSQRMVAKFVAFQLPPVEIVKVTFDINGWEVPSNLLDHVMQTGEWGLR